LTAELLADVVELTDEEPVRYDRWWRE
jgi:hypothetical protein